MNVYTSYYANLSRDLKGLVPVAISTSVPQWFPWIVEEMRVLVPGWNLVNGIKSGVITSDEYTECYLKKLNQLDKASIWVELENISKRNDNRDLVLLCYERRGEFCHRHIVANWLGGVNEL